MNAPNIRSSSACERARPPAASARSIMPLAPPPIIRRASSYSTGGKPSCARMRLSVEMRSGAVSIKVPSRSKTMVSMSFRVTVVGRQCKALGSKSEGGYTPFMNVDAYKRAAADRALEFVRSGMRLGLGTGSTAQVFVELLAPRVHAGLDVVAVPTSEATRAQAERLGIPLATLDDMPELDLTID